MPLDPSSGAIDVILGVAALVTLVSLIRSWGSFWDEDFTVADRRLGGQVAVFLVPPVVVLLHEVGHLVMAQGLGVEVTSFRYGLFEGSVTVAGRLTANQHWVIAVAGNLVSVLVGAAMVGAGLRGPNAAAGLRGPNAVAGRRGPKWRRPLRYVLITGGLLQVLFSLVGYPLLSLLTSFGDWVVIYDFGSTPGLSAGMAVVHVAALVGLRRWWRRRGRQTLFAISTGSEERVAELRSAVEAAPQDPMAWLTLADLYARAGELGLARSTLDEGVEKCGDNPRLHLGRARVSFFQGRWRDTVTAARQGLDSGHAEEDDSQRLWANLALAQTELALIQMERPEAALGAYANLRPPVADDLRVRYGRGLMRLASGDEQGGREDLRAVVDALPENHLLRRWAEARLEGHPLEEPPDTSVPAYARREGPPPAPVAGV